MAPCGLREGERERIDSLRRSVRTLATKSGYGSFSARKARRNHPITATAFRIMLTPEDHFSDDPRPHGLPPGVLDVLQASVDAMFVLDPEGWIVELNAVAVSRYGYPRDRLLTMNVRDLTPERLQHLVADRLTAALAGGVHFEWTHHRADDIEFPVQIASAPVELMGRRFVYSRVRDISVPASDEERVRNLLRAHAVLTGIDRVMHRERDLPRILEETCRVAVEQGGFLMAWIGLADPATRQVAPVASAGRAEGYLDQLRIELGDGPRGQGPTGRALRAGQHRVCNDIEHDPAMAPWRAAALALGFRASAAFPLVVEGETRGALNLYADRPGCFDDEVVRLYDDLALDIALAMERSQQRQLRLEAERNHLEERALLRAFFDSSLDALLVTAPDGRILSANPAACAMFGANEEEICRLGREGTVHTDDPRTSAFITSRAATGKALSGLTLRRADGTLFEAEVSSAIFDSQHGPRTSLVIRDVSERLRAERERLENARRLEEAARIGRLGWWERDVATGAYTFSAALLANLGLDAHDGPADVPALMAMVHPADRDRLHQAMADAMETGRYGIEFRTVRPDGPVRWVRSEGELVRDADDRPIHFRGIGQDITERAELQQALRDSRDDLRAVTTRLQQVEDEERQRLARDLHDSVGQLLSAAGINLALLRQQIPAGSPSTLLERLDATATLLEDAVRELRVVITDLRPPLLDRFGLAAALRSHAEAVAGQTGLPVEVEGDSGFLPPPVALALYRITQEALHNAVRHARPTRVRISLEDRPSGVHLTVSDDGQGFDPGQPDPTGWGLAITRERADGIGASLDLDSSPGDGTRLRVSWPRPAAPPPGEREQP
jgi:PAS domain S-box-containing protein